MEEALKIKVTTNAEELQALLKELEVIQKKINDFKVIIHLSEI